MERCKWFRTEWPTSPRKLAKALNSRQFSERTDSGFIVGRVRDDYLEARFIERVAFTEQVVDPFGTEHLIQRLEYRQSSFRASSEAVGLEIYDPPRSSRLLAELQEVCDFELVLSSLNIDVLKWASRVSKTLRSKAAISTIQVGDLNVAPGVAAKLLVGGLGDVLVAAEKLIAGRPAITEKVQIRLGESKGLIQLTRAGTAKFSSSHADDVLPLLRAALGSQFNEQNSGASKQRRK